MNFYDEIQKLADSVLRDFKQGFVKLIHYEETEDKLFDDEEREVETLDEPNEMKETIYDLNATVNGVSFKYLINSYAVASDLTVTSGVIEGVTPTINDFIEINGVRHKIIRDISPAPNAVDGKPVVWRFICRKG